MTEKNRSSWWYDLPPSGRALLLSCAFSVILTSLIAWLIGGMSVGWFLGVAAFILVAGYKSVLDVETADAVHSERRRNELRNDEVSS